jgi:hypothetical protein
MTPKAAAAALLILYLVGSQQRLQSNMKGKVSGDSFGKPIYYGLLIIALGSRCLMPDAF